MDLVGSIGDMLGDMSTSGILLGIAIVILLISNIFTWSSLRSSTPRYYHELAKPQSQEELIVAFSSVLREFFSTNLPATKLPSTIPTFAQNSNRIQSQAEEISSILDQLEVRIRALREQINILQA
jgi:seryl-tRNA(Sec) selenium transferase